MLRKKSIIDTGSLSLEDIDLIFANADSFLEVSERDVKKVPALRGKTIVNLFFEPSTRTRTSFEIAAKRLSADIINFSSSTSSVKKGESVIDTLKTILSMKVDLIVMRHSDSGAVKMAEQFVNVPVINAGDGKHQHPTQALLDLYTIKKIFNKLEGLKVAIIGDFINSRVAKSDIDLFERMGIDVTVVSPAMLLPEDFSRMKVKHSIDDVIEESDIIYVLRMQFERQNRKFYPSIMEYNRFLSLNKDRLLRMKPGSIVMHPGPVNRGIEITDEVMDISGEPGERITIEQQVTNGVAIRMAVLYLILS
ncbi:MAG: aspartate carbamoyltransferase catalytic subunit [Actinomycetota bacterium]|nr:aspartate carbamoyltransferase catalytic subunit [Actinomycetota bacterium]MDD5600138.1 aspartate carbamoyltransferase catalytic subunit [Actinomycetota bacterium]